MKLLKIKELWKAKPEDTEWKENTMYLDIEKVWCLTETDIKEVWNVWITEKFNENLNRVLVSVADKDEILKLL